MQDIRLAVCSGRTVPTTAEHALRSKDQNSLPSDALQHVPVTFSLTTYHFCSSISTA